MLPNSKPLIHYNKTALPYGGSAENEWSLILGGIVCIHK